MSRKRSQSGEEERRLRELGPGEGRVAPPAYRAGEATTMPYFPEGGDAEVEAQEKGNAPSRPKTGPRVYPVTRVE